MVFYSISWANFLRNNCSPFAVLCRLLYSTVGNPRPTRTLVGSAFSPAAAAVVVPDFNEPNTAAIGTLYTFLSPAFDSSNVDNSLITFSLEGESFQAFVDLDGHCTRTGFSGNSVEGYCHFTYTASSEDTILGTFAAEGPLLNPDTGANDASIDPCSSLLVTGGTGVFVAVQGVVAFCPAVLDNSLSPPLVESLPLTLDLFDDVDGYLHNVDLALDLEFLMME